MGYDQWKTASPYDDEPDVVEECERVAKECSAFIEAHTELSDITRTERALLESCKDTLNFAAEFIRDEL